LLLAQDTTAWFLEASDTPGGLAADREFHPGFHASVAHSVSHFSQKIASDLKLASHGFEATPRTLPTIGLSADKNHVVVQKGGLRGASTDDADAYQDYSRLMRRFADVLQPFWLKTMPRIGSTSLADMMTFAHVGLNIRRMGFRRRPSQGNVELGRTHWFETGATIAEQCSTPAAVSHGRGFEGRSRNSRRRTSRTG
jgi:hypothetical protein